MKIIACMLLLATMLIADPLMDSLTVREERLEKYTVYLLKKYDVPEQQWTRKEKEKYEKLLNDFNYYGGYDEMTKYYMKKKKAKRV